MEFEAFTGKVKKAVAEYVGGSVRTDITYVTKNNGLRLCGLILAQEKGNVALTIYLEPFFDEFEAGATLGEIIKEILDIYEKNKGSGFIDMSLFSDYNKLRPKLGYRLVNYEKNREMLENHPFVPFLDLAAVVSCYLVNDWGAKTNFLIDNKVIEKLRVDPKQVHRDALKNMQMSLPTRIEPMGIRVDELRYCAVRDCMEAMLKEQRKKHGEEWFEIAWRDIQKCIRRYDLGVEQGRCMYLLTNDIHYFGASVLLYDHFLEGLAREWDSNFFILPSSVNEVIAMTESGLEDRELLYEMVEYGNREVSRLEYLSDSVYYFDRLKGTLSILK